MFHCKKSKEQTNKTVNWTSFIVDFVYLVTVAQLIWREFSKLGKTPKD